MSETEDIKKIEGQFKLAVMDMLNVFDMYGLGIHIPQVTNELLEYARIYHLRRNGNDIPFPNNERLKGLNGKEQ